jgi:hypothetical protein
MTRRSVLALAGAAASVPLLGLPAFADERLTFADLWTPDFDFSAMAARRSRCAAIWRRP